MATVTLCDHDGNPAQFRVSIHSYRGSTLSSFDCCSPECAAMCLAEHLATPPAPSPAEAPAVVEEPAVVDEPTVVEKPTVEEAPVEELPAEPVIEEPEVIAESPEPNPED